MTHWNDKLLRLKRLRAVMAQERSGIIKGLKAFNVLALPAGPLAVTERSILLTASTIYIIMILWMADDCWLKPCYYCWKASFNWCSVALYLNRFALTVFLLLSVKLLHNVIAMHFIITIWFIIILYVSVHTLYSICLTSVINACLLPFYSTLVILSFFIFFLFACFPSSVLLLM